MNALVRLQRLVQLDRRMCSAIEKVDALNAYGENTESRQLNFYKYISEGEFVNTMCVTRQRCLTIL